MMRRTGLVGLVVVMVTMMVVVSVLPETVVQADSLLQGVPSVEGVKIYFSEISNDASRFDRTDAGLSRLAGLLELTGAELHTLEWRTGIPDDAALVIIPGPLTDLTADQTAWLWTYLQGGGRVLLLSDPPVGSVRALKSNSGLYTLAWNDMGLRGRDDIIVAESDSSHMAVPPADRVRAETPTPTPMPAVQVPDFVTDFVTTNVNSAHPINAGLGGGLVFFGARSIEVDEAPRPAQVTGLLYANANQYGESAYAVYLTDGYADYNPEEDTASGSLVLAAAMEDSSTGARMVIIGDREFATNGGGFMTSPPYSASFVFPDNVRFMMNAVSWLLEIDAQLNIAFPTPGPTGTPTLTPTPTPEPAS